MIKQGLNDDILEKKFKILRTSIILGNIKNREEMLSNYEETARCVDILRNNVYEELLASKMYTTKTLEEEENRLKDLILFIQNRINERNDFVNDYIKITNNFLDNLPEVSNKDNLNDYIIRLTNIEEYLNNVNEIDLLNNKLKSLRNELENKYENKASNEIINDKLEDELIAEFNKIITNDEYYKKLNYMDIDNEIVNIDNNLKDKYEVMNTFISSYEALKDAGISGAEREEYLSYVNDSKKDYYCELEKKYILSIYKLVLDKESNYDALYNKREYINNILIDRLNKRKELDINNHDILDYFIKLCNEQFSVIKAQKINNESIDKLIIDISNCENRLDELDKLNNREEIINLLNEFDVNKKEIEKIELPSEEEIHEEVIKENNEVIGTRPSNMVVKVSEPVKINVKNATDVAKLVMKKVVIVLEPKKFNNKKDKLKEAEKELEKEKKENIEITSKKDNNDIFINNSSDVNIILDTKEVSKGVNDTIESNEIKINIPSENISIPTEIIVEEEKTKPVELFSETDPFLDDNEFDLDKDGKENVIKEIPVINNLGSVKPNSILNEIKEVTEENDDIILPTNGLTNNEKKEVPIVSENYIN